MSFSPSGMSFPFAFGTQVAAIMDVLTKAVVAEITKLVEEGAVVLRLEVQRRDTEIQELRSSLKMMEAELSEAQEAAARRAAEKEEEQTTARSLILRDQSEGHEEHVVFPELKPADLLCEGFSGKDQNQNISPAVKQEPETELHITETTNRTATEIICSNAENQISTNILQGDSVWPCGIFENRSAPVQRLAPIFPSSVEPYSACRDVQGSYNSLSSSRAELADSCLSVPVKVEERIHPVNMENTCSVRHDSHPVVLQDECVQPASQWAGPSAVLPQRATAGESNSEHGNKFTISLKGKRLTNMKLFICSVCNKGFTYLSQLEHHKTTHHSLKPFRCLECGKFFTQKTRLKTHQRVHTGERPFSCKICGKKFSRRDNCLRHERFHGRAKQCDKSFALQTKLRLHEEIHLLGR